MSGHGTDMFYSKYHLQTVLYQVQTMLWYRNLHFGTYSVQTRPYTPRMALAGGKLSRAFFIIGYRHVCTVFRHASGTPIFGICLVYAWYIPSICHPDPYGWYIHGIYMGYTWYIHGNGYTMYIQGYTWYIHKVYGWYIHCISMVYHLTDIHGISLDIFGYPWIFLSF